MTRAIHKLNVRKVEALSEVGWHGDGGGLFLRIREDGSKRWIYTWKRGTKKTEMFLGTVEEFNLDAIREMAAAARQYVRDGRDPLEIRKQHEQARRAEHPTPIQTSQPVEASAASATPTFGKFADEYIATHEDGWRNEKHRWQWRNSITNHCKLIVNKPVDQINSEDVLDVLRPMWKTIPDTAGRVRARIERILDAAKASDHIASPWENPARWQGNLVYKLPKRKRMKKGHYAAIDYEEMPAFFKSLAARPAPAARALELTILCATRTSETLKMRWEEVDLDRAIWTVPGERMKMGITHRIPLSDAAVALLKQLARESNRRPGDFVFPGQKPGMPLSQMSMIMVMRRMNLGHYTVHGMRSSFRDYMGDMTPHAEAIIEHALAHSVGDSTVRAYRRKDAFEKRRLVMRDWAQYLTRAAAPSKVFRMPTKRVAQRRAA